MDKDAQKAALFIAGVTGTIAYFVFDSDSGVGEVLLAIFFAFLVIAEELDIFSRKPLVIAFYIMQFALTAAAVSIFVRDLRFDGGLWLVPVAIIYGVTSYAITKPFIVHPGQQNQDGRE